MKTTPSRRPDAGARRRVVTIEPTATARAAARRMAQEHVGFLVVTEGARPVGVVTDRDLALRALRSRTSPGELPVSETMSSPPILIRVGQREDEAAELMRRHRIRKLPIVDDALELVDVFTADDLVQSLARELHELSEAVTRGFRNEAAAEGSSHATFGKE